MAKARAFLKVEEVPAILIELGKEGSHPILESKSKHLCPTIWYNGMASGQYNILFQVFLLFKIGGFQINAINC